MPGFFDKLGKVAAQTAAAAQQAAGEAKIKLDIRNLQGKIEEKAQELGLLMYRQHKGEEIPEEEYNRILGEMDQIEVDKAAKEAELAASQAAAGTAPAAAPAAHCVKCGAVITPGAKFCPSCGSPQA